MAADFAPPIAAPDVIVSLAAEHRHGQSEQNYWRVNVKGASNVCAFAARAGVHTLLFASSVAVYGDLVVNAGEDAPLRPTTPYGRSKVAAEDVYRRWQLAAPGRTLVIVRLPSVIGLGGGSGMNRLLELATSPKFVMVGDGANRRSLAYVDNVGAFLEYALRRGPGAHTFNYVDKPDLPMAELIAVARRAVGQPECARWRVPYWAAWVPAAASDLSSKLTGVELPLSIGRLRQLAASAQFETAVPDTGFTAPVSLSDGLTTTVRAARKAVSRDLHLD